MTPGSKRVLTLALVLLAALAISTTASAAPSRAKLAQQLAGKVAGAKTDGARLKALRAVARSLGLGVRNARGRLIVRSKPGRLVLFDDQLAGVGDALRKRQTIDAAALAGQLAAMGIPPKGWPIPALALSSRVAKATKSAARRKGRGNAFGALLVRELGRKRRFAKSDPAKAGAAKLDALQVLIFTTDILDTLVARARARTGTARSARTKSSFCQQAEDLTSDIPALGAFGQWVDEALELSKSAAGKAIGGSLTVLHAASLAYSIEVKEIKPSAGATHYGHDGAPQKLKFGITVRMLDDYGKEAVKCLKLIGVEVPEKGPVPDVKMVWDVKELEKHGEVDCTDALTGCYSKTDTEGLASLTFTPKREQWPEVGPLQVEHGVVTGIALYQQKFGNLPGIVGQRLTPKYGIQGYTVSRHEPNLFYVTLTAGQARFNEHKESLDPTCGWTSDHVWQHDFADTFGEIVHIDDTGGAWKVVHPAEPTAHSALHPKTQSYVMRDYNENEGDENCGSGDSHSECGPRTTDPDTGGALSGVLRLTGEGRKIKVEGYLLSCDDATPFVLPASGTLPEDFVNDRSRTDTYVIKGSSQTTEPISDTDGFWSGQLIRSVRWELRFQHRPN